jgi:2-oxoglutarate ferredoxin oxidoreductase subunit gamma
MNARHEFIGIVLAGVGGQGLVTIGTLLGEAAVLEGRNACLSSTYGTEARGTFTKSDVLIADGEIDFIEAVEPDFVLCLAQAACDRYTPLLGEKSVLLYDSSLVTPAAACRATMIGLPVSSLASEEGFERAANLLALGAIVALSGAVGKESVLSVLEKRRTSGAPLGEKSAEAFEKGFREAEKRSS